MNRFVFAATFALGLVTVGWVAWGFVGASLLALAMTAVICVVYVLGALEVSRFRRGTAALAAMLDDIAKAGGTAQPPTVAGMAEGLQRLPGPLRNPVKQRLEGERAVLPGLALTPYLVGLLVMLGMLGTFLGMVVTFKGAVFALEGSTDLQAIRSALSEPIKGLGLAFGTSVAGVAASAMLGLMSALSRRERIGVARRLDVLANTAFRPLSLAHQRGEAFKALQLQAHALPDIVERLQAMMDGLERRSEQLNAQLVGQQAHFHEGVTAVYTDLAKTVGHSLSESLAAGAKAAGDSIRPVVEAAMAEISAESTRLHQRVFDATEARLAGLTHAFGATAKTVGEGWATALENHARTSEQQADRLGQALAGFTDTFEQRSGAWLATVQEAAAESQAKQAAADQQRLQVFTESLEAMAATSRAAGDGWAATLQNHARDSETQVERLGQSLDGFAETFGRCSAALLAQVHEAATGSQDRQAESDRQRLQAWTAALEVSGATLHGEWQRVGTQTLEAQRAAAVELAQTASDITGRAGEQAARTLEDMAGLVARSEALVQSRIEAEAQWTGQHGERMDELAGLWRSELGALRADEDARGRAAVERLAELQSAVTAHLATLGTALEAPMARLMQTASEVPRAAAEVITQLRQEMTRLSERDNLAFEERSGLLEKISALLQSLNHASGEQRAAIESLVESAQSVLDGAGRQFSTTLVSQADKAADASAHVAGSAVELSSLGESFSHSVQLFSASNEKLVDSLQRIEGTIGRSVERSDEQLAYYVAQAREVIDLSISSQHALVEELRRRDGRKNAATAKVSAE
ncbi:MAG: DUF802 domain-containing protein [Comamonadaceae bacterium]|nr:MAG: DUF802 domain-containing protein [Comamonadaceae bacterium]